MKRLQRGFAADVHEEAVGKPAAPVTIIEYSSLSCPHCAQLHVEVLPALQERDIDTGKARMIFRDLPLAERAMQAAIIGHCGGPGRYRDFVDVFLQTQDRWTRASEPLVELKHFGRLGGLGEDQMEACLRDENLVEDVLQQRLDAHQEHDVDSVPTFIIGGMRVVGNRDIESFAEFIEALLAAPEEE